MTDNTAVMADLWSLALDRGYVYGEIESPTGEEFFGDGPIACLISHPVQSRAVEQRGVTDERARHSRGDRGAAGT